MDSAKTTAVVAAVIALLIGGGAGYFIGNSMGEDDTQSTSTTSSQSTDKMTKDEVDGVTVGGAKMVRSLDIVDNAANASNVTTVVSLVKQANLVETLKGVGPFTVFGPNNSAFEAVPKDILDKIAGDNALLTTVLTYHVVPGTYTSADLKAMAGKGETVKTVQGGTLSFKLVNNEVVVVDATNQEVMIETADVISSNGVTHVIKNVLLPVDPATL